MTNAERVFLALKVVHDRQRVVDDQDRSWIDAFKAIGWAVGGDRRAILTEEGQRAFQELAERQDKARRG